MKQYLRYHENSQSNTLVITPKNLFFLYAVYTKEVINRECKDRC